MANTRQGEAHKQTVSIWLLLNQTFSTIHAAGNS